MANPPLPPNEQPSTYLVQSRSNHEEMSRLQAQDRLVTAGMGGVLPEQPNPASLQSILDVGCATGGWLIQVAQTYPTIPQLVGVDISGKMIEHARKHAEAEQVGKQVEFRVMDALRGLKFPDAQFDLVNLRLGDSWLRTWDWPGLLQEFLRVVRPGGVIRVTESDMVSDNGGSPLLARATTLLVEAFYQSGHYFAADWNGMLNHLPRVFNQYGVQNVQTRAHHLKFPAGTAEGDYMLENIKHAFQTLLPFLHKWSRVPADFEATYPQMLAEMQHPNFCATWTFLTIWGTKPVPDA